MEITMFNGARSCGAVSLVFIHSLDKSRSTDIFFDVNTGSKNTNKLNIHWHYDFKL